MYHTPLTWYEQENLGHKAHFRVVCWITETLPIGHIGLYMGSQNP